MGGQVSPTGTAEVRPVAVSPPTMFLVAALACVTFAEGALLGIVVGALTAGSAAGLLIAAEVFQAGHNVRAVLWIPAKCLIAASIVTFRLIPETRHRAPRITIGHTDIPRQSGYVGVWLICAAAALVSLVIVAAATRGGAAGQHDPRQL